MRLELERGRYSPVRPGARAGRPSEAARLDHVSGTPRQAAKPHHRADIGGDVGLVESDLHVERTRSLSASTRQDATRASPTLARCAEASSRCPANAMAQGVSDGHGRHGDDWPSTREEPGTRRDFLYLLTGATAAVGAAALVLAADRPDEPVGRRAGARLDRGRHLGRSRRAWRSSDVAQAAGVRPQPHAGRDRGGARGAARRAARPADRTTSARPSPSG